MEIVPGKKLGRFELELSIDDIVNLLDCDYKYEVRRNGSVLVTESNYFMFDEAKKLRAVVTKGAFEGRFNGIGYRTSIADVVKKFNGVNIDDEGRLTIEGYPGIGFDFSESDTELLFDAGVHNEGIGEDVLDIEIDSICISRLSL